MAERTPRTNKTAEQPITEAYLHREVHPQEFTEQVEASGKATQEGSIARAETSSREPDAKDENGEDLWMYC